LLDSLLQETSLDTKLQYPPTTKPEDNIQS